MCGITGYWDRSGADVSVAEAMALKIRHRGPDDSGNQGNDIITGSEYADFIGECRKCNTHRLEVRRSLHVLEQLGHVCLLFTPGTLLAIRQ